MFVCSFLQTMLNENKRCCKKNLNARLKLDDDYETKYES